MSTILHDTTTTPCPSWCTLPNGHHVDSIHPDGRQSRDHSGPHFGSFLSGSAREFTDAPSILRYEVMLYESPDPLAPSQLLDLATDAIAAAKWLEAHR